MEEEGRGMVEEEGRGRSAECRSRRRGEAW
jgi:hypothetical protein